MKFTYILGNNIYVNLTNRCPCACEFCIRNDGDTVGNSESLWLEHEPSAEDVIAELQSYDFSQYGEVVFCGYGEPTCALDVLLQVATWLKSQNIKTRLNTNGLSDLVHGRPTSSLFRNLIDTVSISLNASTAEKYDKLCHPQFGLESYYALLKFAKDCMQCVENVTLTIVDVVGEDEINACKAIAKENGIPLRVRKFQ